MNLMTQHKPLPCRSEILKHLHYDPETGLFWWIKSGKRRTLSRPAGCKAYRKTGGEPGKIEIRLNNRLWLAHRLAWVIMTGEDPGDMTIDHINGPIKRSFICLQLLIILKINGQALDINGYE